MTCPPTPKPGRLGGPASLSQAADQGAGLVCPWAWRPLLGRKPALVWPGTWPSSAHRDPIVHTHRSTRKMSGSRSSGALPLGGGRVGGEGSDRSAPARSRCAEAQVWAHGAVWGCRGHLGTGPWLPPLLRPVPACLPPLPTLPWSPRQGYWWERDPSGLAGGRCPLSSTVPGCRAVEPPAWVLGKL